MDRLKKNWWWIYSLVSGLDMVFYISALLRIARLFHPDLVKLSPQIIAMGAVSSALFYCILRWPQQNKKSSYLFAAFYGLLLSGGAYIIQSFHYAQVPLQWKSGWSVWLLITFVAVVFYSPQSIRAKWGLGLRRYYLVKPLVVAWCWTIWALMPLIFIQPPQIMGFMMISLLFVFALVLITDIIDRQTDQASKTIVNQWGVPATIVLLLSLILISEWYIWKTMNGYVSPGKIMMAASVPLMSLLLKRKYLSALLVDGALVIFYFLN